MQTFLVLTCLSLAVFYLGRKLAYHLYPKKEKCATCAFGEGTKKRG